MSAEAIYKLQPHRTMHLRGFDRYGAAASLHSTSASAWTVSGVFRDAADFAVLVLWDADDYFGHYQTTKYLPDFDCAGMTLDFDFASTNLQWIESLKFPSIDWPFIDYIATDGTTGQVRLSDYITARTGRTNATLTYTVSAGVGSIMFDRVTLSFGRYQWDYVVPGKQSVTFGFFNYHGAGFVHSLVIGSATYNYTQLGTDSSTDVATGVRLAAAADANCSIGQTANNLTLTPLANSAATITVNAPADNGPDTMWLTTNAANTIAAYMRTAINGTSWDAGTPVTCAASGATNQIVLTFNASNYGAAADANMAYVFEQHKTATTTITPSGRSAISGAVESSSVHISIPFSTAFGSHVSGLRQLWLTLAPKLTNGAAYTDQEWSATATNWTVADPSGHRALKISGAGSVRVVSRDAWVAYTGASWVEEASNQPGGTGWFHNGFARRGSAAGDKVMVRYACQSAHDLWIGTALYSDRGIVSVSIDGGGAFDFDPYLANGLPLVTRRKLAAGIAAGEHIVTFTISGRKNAASTGYYFYFDFLEAVVASDVPDPAQTYATVMPATDYDTDHAFKLSPQRLVWMLDRMGFRGTLDHYLGVFWWAQRKRVLGVGQNAFHAVTVTFASWAGLVEDLQQLKLQFGGAYQGDPSGSYVVKQYLPTDTDASLARFFADFINGSLVGVWASISGAVLTITSRAPSYSFAFWAFAASTDGGATFGTLTTSGDLNAGDLGQWVIDDTVMPIINRAVTDWHADFWSEIFAKGWSAVAALSMELVNPPEAIGHIYAQRFADGTPVETDTGFAGLKSTQCTFNGIVRDYQKVAFKEIAGLMAAAGLTPWLQYGEFLWWFFDWYGSHHAAGMAFYDADTSAAAAAALGRSLATFSHTTDDPSINGFADADFLRGLIYAHCSAITTYVKAAYGTAKFEILWPLDVNYPSLTAIASLGGRLNRYVNLPNQWVMKAGSGLDRFKVEALAFGASERDIDKARETMAFPTVGALSWAQADTAYLIPIFNGGCPWTREYLDAKREGVPLLNLWALDHICLLAWPLPLPVEGRAIGFVGG